MFKKVENILTDKVLIVHLLCTLCGEVACSRVRVLGAGGSAGGVLEPHQGEDAEDPALASPLLPPPQESEFLHMRVVSSQTSSVSIHDSLADVEWTED